MKFFIYFISLFFSFVLFAESVPEVAKVQVTWEEVTQLSQDLQKQIVGSSFDPDVVIGISRGGLVPARLLSDLLDKNGLFIIRVAFYTAMGKTQKEPKLLQGIEKDIVQGKSVLLVDDVADSGRSLAFAITYLQSFSPREIKVATLHYKRRSCVTPDFYAKLEERWIIYPWEAVESR
ncbi:MAG: phosphoribosyltransferase [Chlamydiota bacterium]